MGADESCAGCSSRVQELSDPRSPAQADGIARTERGNEESQPNPRTAAPRLPVQLVMGGGSAVVISKRPKTQPGGYSCLPSAGALEGFQLRGVGAGDPFQNSSSLRDAARCTDR